MIYYQNRRKPNVLPPLDLYKIGCDNVCYIYFSIPFNFLNCRAAPEGYLPAAADYDYEEDLAGYSADQADTRNDDLAGYVDDNLSGYESGSDDQASDRSPAQYGDDQQQYGDESAEDDAQVRDGEQGQYGDQDQYGEDSGAEPKSADEANENPEEGYSAPDTAASDPSRSADEGYGAPAVGSASNLDPSYTAPDASRTADDGYGAPEDVSGDADTGYTVPDVEAAARDVEGEYSAPSEYEDPSRNAEYAAPSDSDYAAPAEDALAEAASRNVDTAYTSPEGAAADSDYAAPGADAARTAEDEYGAPGEYEGDFPFENVEGQSRDGSAAASAGSGGSKLCPGGSIEVCVEVCPGITARVYGACVQGCADRCPEF